MRNRKVIIWLLLVVIGILSSATFAQSRIGGGRWQLTELNGKVVPNSRIYVEFDESSMRVSGHAGCNRFFGRYERKGQAFKATVTGSTKMACMKPGLMETESEFLKALNDASRLRRTGQTLSIFAGRDRVLRFKLASKDRPTVAAGLSSHKWVLKSVGGQQVTLNNTLPFITFDAEKMSVGGNSGCNGFGGSYAVNGPSLSISDVISTMMACEAEGRMEIERGLFDGLRSADRFEIMNGRLFLYKGTTQLLEFEGTAK